MYHRENIREINEALSAARTAIEKINYAKQSLNNAKNWGVFDMLGGGIISSMVKHSKIDNAQNVLRQVNGLLQKLNRELEDISVPDELNIEINGFAKFADYFFDGLISDWYVQNKINENRRRVDEPETRVYDVIYKLEKLVDYEKKNL